MLCENCNKDLSNLKRKPNINNHIKNFGQVLCVSCQFKLGFRNSAMSEERKIKISQSVKKMLALMKQNEPEKFKKIGFKTGKNNPANKNGKNWTNTFNYKHKGKTYEEIYGEEKAKEIKEKISLNNSGENNPMYGKPAPKKSGNGWSGYYKEYYFRSLLELSYIKYLLDNNIKFKSAENKNFQIKYAYEGKIKNYYPDFYLIDTHEIIELKPKNLLNNLYNNAKFEAAKEKYGDKFIILTEDNIDKLQVNEILTLLENKNVVFNKNSYEKFLNYARNNI